MFNGDLLFGYFEISSFGFCGTQCPTREGYAVYKEATISVEMSGRGFIKALFRHFPGVAEGDHEEPQRRQPVSPSRFEPEIS
jgi:hypothetical protein